MSEPSQQIKITHNGVEIVYNESQNVFEFTLRGRERSAPSLAKAKEAIDKVPDPKDPNEKPFERIKCYCDGGYFDKDGTGHAIVEVTSVADGKGYYGGPEFWASGEGSGYSRGKKLRSKVYGSHLFPVNDKNTAIIEQLKVKYAERAKLDEEIEALKKKRQQIKI